jgi:serine/threonine protein kinase
MELLDERLTKILECSQQLLAYCIQVDICHDIVFVITYLRSNDIVHRYLSNNVLMIAERRANVTDFGIYKLVISTSSIGSLCLETQACLQASRALREP